MSQPIDLETMRRVAGLAGFEWSDAELEALRPLVDASLRMLAGLETLPLDEVEPTTQYRIL
jgi:Asp-tRNA(Asn)/Glu-tRNA(Gln) amidotransferase C subunit